MCVHADPGFRVSVSLPVGSEDVHSHMRRWDGRAVRRWPPRPFSTRVKQLLFAVTTHETRSHLQLGLCLTSAQEPPSQRRWMSDYRFVPRLSRDGVMMVTSIVAKVVVAT